MANDFAEKKVGLELLVKIDCPSFLPIGTQAGSPILLCQYFEKTNDYKIRNFQITIANARDFLKYPPYICKIDDDSHTFVSHSKKSNVRLLNILCQHSEPQATQHAPD